MAVVAVVAVVAAAAVVVVSIPRRKGSGRGTVGVGLVVVVVQAVRSGLEHAISSSSSSSRRRSSSSSSSSSSCYWQHLRLPPRGVVRFLCWHVLKLEFWHFAHPELNLRFVFVSVFAVFSNKKCDRQRATLYN